MIWFGIVVLAVGGVAVRILGAVRRFEADLRVARAHRAEIPAPRRSIEEEPVAAMAKSQKKRLS